MLLIFWKVIETYETMYQVCWICKRECIFYNTRSFHYWSDRELFSNLSLEDMRDMHKNIHPFWISWELWPLCNLATIQKESYCICLNRLSCGVTQSAEMPPNDFVYCVIAVFIKTMHLRILHTTCIFLFSFVLFFYKIWQLSKYVRLNNIWLSLFSKVKTEKRIRMKENVMRQLMVIPKNDFVDHFGNWKGSWDKIVRSQGKRFKMDYGAYSLWVYLF